MEDIKGYERFYAITREGHVWSYPKTYHVGKRLSATIHTIGKFLKPGNNGRGYMFVYLYQEGRVKRQYVHRLVANSFIDNPNFLPEVNHKNGIKTDNRIENLEWCSSADNLIHGARNNLLIKKLTNSQVMEIRKLCEEKKLTKKEISLRFNVSDTLISFISSRKARIHI